MIEQEQLIAAAVVLAYTLTLIVVGAVGTRIAKWWEARHPADVEDTTCPECGADVEDGDWHEPGCVTGMEVAQDWADEAAVAYRQDEGW